MHHAGTWELTTTDSHSSSFYIKTISRNLFISRLHIQRLRILALRFHVVNRLHIAELVASPGLQFFTFTEWKAMRYIKSFPT